MPSISLGEKKKRNDLNLKSFLNLCLILIRHTTTNYKDNNHYIERITIFRS